MTDLNSEWRKHSASGKTVSPLFRTIVICHYAKTSSDIRGPPSLTSALICSCLGRESHIKNSFRLVKEIEFQLCDFCKNIFFFVEDRKEALLYESTSGLKLMLKADQAAIPPIFNLLAG
jgi:hypothetical protein